MAPDIEMHGEELSEADESTLYHHFEMNYTPIDTESGRRLARRCLGSSGELLCCHPRERRVMVMGVRR